MEWVPAPRLRGGRISTRGQRVGVGDGSPHSRGQGRGWATARDVASGYGRRDGSPRSETFTEPQAGDLIGKNQNGVQSQICTPGFRLGGRNDGWDRGLGAGGQAVREPPLRKEHIVGHWVHPHPNLPPSRGKGFVGDKRAIFIVMPCGGCAAFGGGGRRRCLGGCNYGIVYRAVKSVYVGGRP